MARLEKSVRHRWLGGVASGLARSFGIDSFGGRLLVRAGFVMFVAALWWLYGLLWLFMPQQKLIDARSLNSQDMETAEHKRLQAKRKALKREYKRIKREAKRSFKRSKRYGYSYTWPKPESTPKPAAALSAEAKVDALIAQAEGHVPEAALTKLRGIQASLVAVLPELESMRRHNSKDAYNVQQIAEAYLPDALERYLALPTDFAKASVLSNGKTAEATLLEQLGLLERTLQRVATDVFREDADALMVHGRFLKEKFAEHPLDIPRASELREAKASQVKSLGKGEAKPFKLDEVEPVKVRVPQKEPGIS